jgi:hypothetical protein
MNVNVRNVWLCMKYEIPQMIQRGAGTIVNMSSGAEFQYGFSVIYQIACLLLIEAGSLKWLVKQFGIFLCSQVA